MPMSLAILMTTPSSEKRSSELHVSDQYFALSRRTNTSSDGAPSLSSVRYSGAKHIRQLQAHTPGTLTSAVPRRAQL